MLRWTFCTWIVSMCLLGPALSFDNEPLILTSYLSEGKFKEAQCKSLVTPDFNGVKSYTGFFTVNKDCGNNLFFWFIPAENNWEEVPVLLWMPEEAYSSTLVGMFRDIGPFNHTRKSGFINRKYHWAKGYNVIFLEPIVGLGFSYTKNKCYPDSVENISKDSYTALVQFFQLFPNLQKNKFFIVGQSFAANFGPGIATEIHRCNGKASVKINLIGLVFGNPYIDLRCHPAASYLYELGVYDEKTRDLFLKFEKIVTKHIDDKNYTGVADLIDVSPEFDDGLANYGNILYDNYEMADFGTYIRNYKVRVQIHVGTRPYIGFSYFIMDKLSAFMYMPTNSYIEELLRYGKYIVGFYRGQLDAYNPPTVVSCVLQQLKWSGADEYKSANRSQWYMGKRLVGWFKVAGNVFEVVMRNSGLYTMRDQPEATLELISAAFADRPGTKLLSKLKTEPPKTNPARR